jgi:hypothetical protein
MIAMTDETRNRAENTKNSRRRLHRHEFARRKSLGRDKLWDNDKHGEESTLSDHFANWQNTPTQHVDGNKIYGRRASDDHRISSRGEQMITNGSGAAKSKGSDLGPHCRW